MYTCQTPRFKSILETKTNLSMPRIMNFSSFSIPTNPIHLHHIYDLKVAKEGRKALKKLENSLMPFWNVDWGRGGRSLGKSIHNSNKNDNNTSSSSQHLQNLLYTRHYSADFTYINAFNPHNSSKISTIIPILQGAHRGIEKLSNLLYLLKGIVCGCGNVIPGKIYHLLCGMISGW